MNTSEHSSNGLPNDPVTFTLPLRKPLTVSPSDDVSFCIETVSGNLVNPTNPDALSIDVHDISWALSRMPRFAGHSITEVPYNVAQHSVYVSELAENILRRGQEVDDLEIAEIVKVIVSMGQPYIIETLKKALFHDGHEAYTGDIPSPVKRIPELRETLKIIELKLDHAIYTHLGLPEMSEEERILIKYCDKMAQAIEGYQYMPSRGKNWNLPKPSLTMLQKFPAPLSPLESYQAFLFRFDYLCGQ